MSNILIYASNVENIPQTKLKNTLPYYKKPNIIFSIF